ncbi:hypothetical protein R6242_00390 [Iodobacter sp. CM08]|uniref:hypothetical protein n=1 Tax=Iodobacter sp. CM08 TaxID=3085902 RepID=UPI002981E745|nr:hypothetical protein [Iodobacter sp. CM08]MDW5415032.1 hypothetical protein [Iodobacter sp. CM08]
MRLDFNVVLVDDEIHDDENNYAAKKLISALEARISSKGFDAKVDTYNSIEQASKALSSPNKNRRIDLYLSDNNLGAASVSGVENSENAGVEYYLAIRSKFICDFVLYTRSSVNKIVDFLVADLLNKKDPNLFSRFTFVSRGTGGDAWHTPILDLIDHILTKREEINNLRGLFAQKTAQMDNHLKARLGSKVNRLNFEDVIELAFSDGLISSTLKNDLHYHRLLRNGVIHHDEIFCETRKKWSIRYVDYFSNSNKTLYESDFKNEREKLSDTFKMVIAI